MIELASVIRDLREELGRAVVAAEGEALRFELGPIELEVTVAVERSDAGGGKVTFWVVEFDGKHTMHNTATQRIKLALTPRLADGSKDTFVGSGAEPGEQW